VSSQYIAAEGAIRPHELNFDWNVLSQKDNNEVTLTIKNYPMFKGLSPTFFFTDQVYEIKGPMGKGLEIKDSGTHVAFTAGTGVLVYIDIVAHMILQALQLIEYDTGSDNSEAYEENDEEKKVDPEVIKFLLDFAGTFENVQGPIVDQVEHLRDERKRQAERDRIEKERVEREAREQTKKIEEERKKKEIEEKKARRRKQMQERLENSLQKNNFEGGEEEEEAGDKSGQVSF